MFAIFDENSDEMLDGKEFVNGLFKVYFSSFESKLKLTFDIYDFDGDGSVSREDIRIILAYIPQMSAALRSMELAERSEEAIKTQMFESRLKSMENIESLL